MTIGVEIAKILSSSIDDSLLAWTELLDGTRIRTLVNLLYLGIIIIAGGKLLAYVTDRIELWLSMSEK